MVAAEARDGSRQANATTAHKTRIYTLREDRGTEGKVVREKAE
jgi:hypothetical protein